MNADPKHFLAQLTEKLKAKTITKKELSTLINFFLNNQKETTWSNKFDDEQTVKTRIHQKILAELQLSEETTKPRVLPLYRRPIFKYSIAASILLLLTLPFILKQNTQSTQDHPLEVIKPNNVSIGTDKATLTLADGSNIVLEKGKTFTKKNIISTGKELIYENNDAAKSAELTYNYLSVPRGGQHFVKLADGTQVWLNSESKLKFPVNFIAGQPREVELVYGEAYFDVSPSSSHQGDSFKVRSNQDLIEVLGTEFNIRAYQDETTQYTTLVEGSINIENNGRVKQLKPAMQAITSSTQTGIKIQQVDTYNETAWKDGIFVFKGKTLLQIMQTLSRWYDVEVVFENEEIKKSKFRGILRKNQPIEEIMSAIQSSSLNGYEINNKTIRLK
ncbi:DUF4974 domain-containing protein [Flavobacteriaceae bacterium F08102]|nr:DUF4974 domain-containing protein [Flavobacteriaceae bacterium F08102]